MQIAKKEGALVPSSTTGIEPVYSKAIAQTENHYKVMVAFVKRQMKKEVDYGIIPGTRKPTLLKPGAEKLCRLFNLRPHLELLNSIVDFEKPLFYFHYRCSLYKDSEMVGEADGCCNSLEVKYQKQKYKIFDLTNTICKVAQKRALVAAVLSSCGASEFFNQDLEEMAGGVR